MIEAGVTALVAALTGMVALHTRLHNKMADIDSRVDQIELRVAEKYVQRTELTDALRKMEDHMVRIENKLDQIALRHD